MLEVTFHIGHTNLADTTNFLKVVKEKIPGLELERISSNDKEILYLAKTTEPIHLMLLGATVFVHNEHIGYYKFTGQQKETAGVHFG